MPIGRQNSARARRDYPRIDLKTGADGRTEIASRPPATARGLFCDRVLLKDRERAFHSVRIYGLVYGRDRPPVVVSVVVVLTVGLYGRFCYIHREHRALGYEDRTYGSIYSSIISSTTI